jgi:hypothetical protein
MKKAEANRQDAAEAKCGPGCETLIGWRQRRLRGSIARHQGPGMFTHWHPVMAAKAAMVAIEISSLRIVMI